MPSGCPHHRRLTRDDYARVGCLVALISAGGDAATDAAGDLYREYPQTWKELYGPRNTDQEDP
jgi:hypothetical protein